MSIYSREVEAVARVLHTKFGAYGEDWYALDFQKNRAKWCEIAKDVLDEIAKVDRTKPNLNGNYGY